MQIEFARCVRSARQKYRPFLCVPRVPTSWFSALPSIWRCFPFARSSARFSRRATAAHRTQPSAFRRKKIPKRSAAWNSCVQRKCYSFCFVKCKMKMHIFHIHFVWSLTFASRRACGPSWMASKRSCKLSLSFVSVSMMRSRFLQMLRFSSTNAFCSFSILRSWSHTTPAAHARQQ